MLKHLLYIAVYDVNGEVECLQLVAFLFVELLDEKDELLTGVIENKFTAAI